MIPFNKPFIMGKELFNIAQAVIEHGILSGDGHFTKLCVRWLEKNLGCESAVLTTSCTAALEMAALLFDIQSGDEVIMPSFTFVSTANAFVLRGATPVFVDIRPDTLNLDHELVEAAITDRTKAIVPVHYAGVGCNMPRILDIAGKYGLFVVEDAAQALMSAYEGKMLGTIGHLGCLSFHETKNIISGEGGALLINDSRFVERARILSEKGTNRTQFLNGQVDKYTWVDLGSSYQPSDMIAAFLYAQFELSDQILQKRCHIYDRYFMRLQPLQEKGLIELPHYDPNMGCNGHLFYILLKSQTERTNLIKHLADRGIMAVFHFVPLHSSPAGKRNGKYFGGMQITDDISARLLRLPLYYDMTDADVDRVYDAIESFFP